MRTLISPSRTRRNIQLAKVIFNLASETKFRKDGNHNTRAMDTYIFDTDIVRLGNYSNSPYYKGANLWMVCLWILSPFMTNKHLIEELKDFQITMNT